ncbi:MAG: OmpA family protein [Pseudomonadota bacterium]|nr:MAG: OmpA family protein [Pseudomonadota bacterium]
MNARIVTKGLAALAIATAIPVAMLSGCADSAPKRPATAAAGSLAGASSTENEAPAAPIAAEQDSDVAAIIDFAKQTEPEDGSDTVQFNQTVSGGEPGNTLAASDAGVQPDLQAVYFGFDASDIDPALHDELRRHAEYLAAHPELTLHLDGHTDSRGSATYNKALSQRRAQAVADLLHTLGASQSQLVVSAHGAGQPRDLGSNWRENRRVELQYRDGALARGD